MSLVQHGDPGFNEEAAKEDQRYLSEIGEQICFLMRKMDPREDYFIIVIQMNDGESAVSLVPKKEGLPNLHKELQLDPNPLFQDVVDRLSDPPSSPLAKWVIICRNGTFRLCSVLPMDISNPKSFT